MPAKIRLQRHGKKGYPFFHIVIADGRAPRNGKFIEKIGTYNPNTNPATIELNSEKALEWLKNGAQPTDTTRAILSYKGVMMKLHLDKGITKGALTAEQAQEKFTKWESEKAGKIEGKKSELATGKTDYEKKRMAEEVARNNARAAAIAIKNTPPAPEPAAAPEEVATEEEAPAVAEVAAEAPAEAPVEVAAEVPADAPAEAPAAENTTPEVAPAEVAEAPAAEGTEEPKA